MMTCFRSLLLAALVLGIAASVQAQLSTDPTTLTVTVPQGEEDERTVTLTNTGSEAVSFCLSFERPLQREGRLQLSERAAGAACGMLGEILYEVSDQTIAIGWDPSGLAMTPDGRLFTADRNSDRTHELTLDLEVIRSFEHPFEDALDFSPSTQGVTYNADTGTLWWLNIEDCSPPPGCIARALLLEGDLDGVPTGRRIELPLVGGDPPKEVSPSRLAYDPAAERYYFNGFNREDQTTAIWAVDTLGTVVPGYPAEQMAYPDFRFTAFDVHGGSSGEPEAVRLEIATATVGSTITDRVAVIDPLGRDLEIETPLPDVSGGTGFGSITGELLRSRVDPNGVLYFAFTNFDAVGVIGIRPHPLPPSWLSVSAWDGTLGPAESIEITLTFKAGTRAVGNTYSAALQVFEAATGAALEVPLTFEVAPETDAEDGAEGRATWSLSVYPNPARGPATVGVVVMESADLQVSVFDMLGREVIALHSGPLPAGPHRFPLDTASLPAGVYLVRATAGAEHATEQIAIVR